MSFISLTSYTAGHQWDASFLGGVLAAQLVLQKRGGFFRRMNNFTVVVKRVGVMRLSNFAPSHHPSIFPPMGFSARLSR